MKSCNLSNKNLVKLIAYTTEVHKGELIIDNILFIFDI